MRRRGKKRGETEREKGIRRTFAQPSVGSAVCLSAGRLALLLNKEEGTKKLKRG